VSSSEKTSKKWIIIAHLCVIKNSRLAIAIENKIYIHNLHDLSPIKSIETSYNPKGLFCFSLNEKILCCPDKHDIGFINIVNIDSNTEIHAKAHSGPLAFIEINAQGNLIGTASVKVWINFEE